MRRFILIAMLLWTALGAGFPSALAVENSPEPAVPESEEEFFSAPVTVDGVVLFYVRGTKSYSAERRVREIRDRILSLAKDPSVSSDSILVTEAGQGVKILSGERHIMWVLDADARMEGVSRQALVRVIVTKIREAIERYRHDRRPEVLRRGALFGVGATAAVLAAFFLFRWLFRKANRSVERRYKDRIQAFKVASFELVRAERLWKTLAGILQGLRILVLLVLLYVYLQFMLDLFPWTRAIGAGLLDLVLDPLKGMGAAAVRYFPDLVFLIVLSLVVRYVLKMVKLFFTGIEQGAVVLSGFDADWARSTYRLVRFLVIAFTVVVAYPYIPGSETEAFKGVSIFLGVIFSLGSSSMISNIVAGYSMIYRRAFKIGDRIRVGEFSSDLIGDVVEMRLLTTHLRTIKNEMVAVPNSLILNSSIINYSKLAHTEGLILYSTVGVGYEASWRQVEAMLVAAAERTPGLLRNPPPFVLQKSLDQFSVTYEINAYCDNPQAMAEIYAELHRNILDQFNQYGVQIMTPAYEGDPENAKVVPKERWHAPPARAPQGSKD